MKFSTHSSLQAKRRRFALLIDGDMHGPKTWGPAREAVMSRGDLVVSLLLASPGHCASKKWQQAMGHLNIQPIAVPRKPGGRGQPNDLAIGMEASRLVSQGEVDSIAVLATDADFAYLAGRVQSWGHYCLALLLQGGGVGIAKAFADAKVDIAWIADDTGGTVHKARKKAVLQPDGTGTIEQLSPQETEELNRTNELQEVTRLLYNLGFINASDEPLISGLAKFYCINALGPLPVWPRQLAFSKAEPRMASAEEGSWQRNPGDLAYVLPYGSGSNKFDAEEYGSQEAARVARGGGPFLLRSSPTLVEEVLWRLGYLDKGLNSDLDEAMTVFCSAKINARNLRDLGFDVPDFLDAHSKRAILHSAIVSPKLMGNWSLAPSDGVVRRLLVSEGLLSHAQAPAEEVLEGLRKYSRGCGLPIRRTYNASVYTVTKHLNAGDTLRRRH